MTIKVFKMARKSVVFLVPLLFSIACENDLNSVDAGLFIDNKNFETLTENYDVSVTTEVIDRVQTLAISDDAKLSLGIPDRYLLGVYNDPNLGTLKASFVTQLKMPANVLVYEDVVKTDEELISTMDSVVLYIPIESSLRTTDIETKGRYKLDSVFGVYNDVDEIYGSFDVQVYELNHFLNDLDPNNPSKANTFYTNDTYTLGQEIGSLNSEGNRKFEVVPSHLNTASLISRNLNGSVYNVENDTLADASPRIAIPLDKAYFDTKFLIKLNRSGFSRSEEFATQKHFIRYFNGLYVKAVSNVAGSMASLKLSDAYVEMYYTNLLRSLSTSLNLDTIKESKKFSFGDLRASIHEHDGLRGSDANKVYIQGATGSEGRVKLFANEADLATLRNNVVNGAIINEASVKFYVDDFDGNTVQRLFLYKITSEGDFQINDYITAANTSGTQGALQEEDGKKFYEFKITDYIKTLLVNGNNAPADQLGLKVFMQGDLPTTVSDINISTNSWDPRGVVLSANNIQLKINYSRIK